MFDCIVIGSGPSGISAAIYLKRFGLDVLVIGKDYGTLSLNTKIENYYGIESIDGVDLIKKGLLQASNLGISVLEEEVVIIPSFPFLNGLWQTHNVLYPFHPALLLSV